jgi:hypothetical protein
MCAFARQHLQSVSRVRPPRASRERKPSRGGEATPNACHTSEIAEHYGLVPTGHSREFRGRALQRVRELKLAHGQPNHPAGSPRVGVAVMFLTTNRASGIKGAPEY